MNSGGGAEPVNRSFLAENQLYASRSPEQDAIFMLSHLKPQQVCIPSQSIMMMGLAMAVVESRSSRYSRVVVSVTSNVG